MEVADRTGGPEGDCCGDPVATPIETTIALPDHGASIAEARHRAAAFLTRGGAGHLAGVTERIVDLTQLVVSELVTNARKYAPGPVLVQLCLDGGEVRVTVWDTDPVLPAALGADPRRVGQHGLEIVKAIAAELTVHREAVGKRITARILLEQ